MNGLKFLTNVQVRSRAKVIASVLSVNILDILLEMNAVNDFRGRLFVFLLFSTGGNGYGDSECWEPASLR